MTGRPEPFFSVIVPVHNTREYLGACLESILSQGIDDIEVVAVDDCSTDGSAEALAEQARDPRVRVITLADRAGPGPARNAGLAAARGRYVLFLDSDDVFTAGALRAIRGRIEDLREPDLLVFDFVLWDEDGGQRPNWQAEQVATAARSGVFSVGQQPGLLSSFNAPWSRAYRRAFVCASGLAFPPGIYEDIPWTMCAVMQAERIGGLDLVVVRYRQRSSGSILRGTESGHFDVFDQWDRVFDAVAAHPEWEEHRPELYAFMISQLDAMLLNPTRVPPASRRRFFLRAAEECGRHVPPGWRPDPGGALMGTRLRQLALRHGRYAPYVGLALAKPWVDSAKRAARGQRKRASTRHVPPVQPPRA